MPHNSDNLYVQLLHGRDDPKQDMDEKGYDGPLIGPVGVSWTYGTVKLHEPGWGEHATLNVRDDLIEHQGKYYGDWEVFAPGDPKLMRKRKAAAHRYETLRNHTA